jgi:TPR repeat protein
MAYCNRLFFKLTAAALILAACLTAPALADKRVALVIGNSAYKSVNPLENPKNDAKLMAETLRSLGFTLVGGAAQLDLDKSGIDHAVQNFGDLLQGADVGLFYYAGHGLQVRGANYLVPIDANPTREADVDFQMLDTSLVLRQMESAGTKLNVVILDACRNNPFGGRGLRATGGGLAQMQAPEGTLISFATQPGNVAKDGIEGNSPFTKALALTLRRPGLDIFRTFNDVGLAVMKATGNVQQPWMSTSPISGDFYFSGAPAPITAPITVPQVVIETPPQPSKEARLTTPTDPLRLDLVTDCDRLAGHPMDPQRSRGALGILVNTSIDVVPALRACSEATRQYPDVARFLFQGGRVALAQKDYATARRMFEQATSMGSQISMADLGLLYMNGYGVSKDFTQARQWYEKGAAAAQPTAMTGLGNLYQNGWGVTRDDSQALRWFEKAAAGGEPNAMSSLGEIYKYGKGVTQDYNQARRWYEKAAAAGLPEAMTNLGYIYENGWGVAKDYTQARQWYEKGIAGGNGEAMTSLGYLYENGWGLTKNINLALQWYQKGAAAGEPTAMSNLGVYYEKGWGVTQDYVQARQWYEKAAAQGNYGAMDGLGNVYLNGWGVTQDYAQARQWYEKASAGGNLAATNELGNLFLNGWGVTKDSNQARLWFEKAAAAGYTSAMADLGNMYLNGTGVPKDYNLARQWYEKGANANEAYGMAGLGYLYMNGFGVTKDYAQARQWLEKSANMGNTNAMYNFAYLYENGMGVTRDLSMARQWYEKSAAGGNDGAKQKLKNFKGGR